MVWREEEEEEEEDLVWSVRVWTPPTMAAPPCSHRCRWLRSPTCTTLHSPPRCTPLTSISSPLAPQCTSTASRLAMVPLGTSSPALIPSRAAARAFYNLIIKVEE